MKNELINDISPAVYDGWKAINYSSLKMFMLSPMHYQHWMQNKDTEEPNDALRVGTATHMLCLQPQYFHERFIICPSVDRRTKEGKIIWEEFKVKSASFKNNWLKEDEAVNCYSIAKAVASNKLFRDYSNPDDNIYREAGFICKFWNSPVKGRIDFYNADKNVIIDIKTISDTPTAQNVYKAIREYKYYYQSYFYSKGIEEVTGKKPKFIFMFVEKKAPHAIAFWELSDDFIGKSEEEIEAALVRYENAKESDIWVGLPNENKVFTL